MQAVPPPYMDRNEGVMHARVPHKFPEIPPSIDPHSQLGSVEIGNKPQISVKNSSHQMSIFRWCSAMAHCGRSLGASQPITA